MMLVVASSLSSKFNAEPDSVLMDRCGDLGNSVTVLSDVLSMPMMFGHDK